MRIAFLLLHDQRFSGWRLADFLFSRYHFAKEYAKRVADKGHEVVLYTLHENLRRVKECFLEGYSVKVLPVKFRFPPFVPVGNSHNFHIVNELNQADYEVVHFHNYYFWSLVLVALAKRSRGWSLVGQYHGEPELQLFGKFVHRSLLGCVDRFLVSTRVEELWLNKLRLEREKVVRLPNVGVDVNHFRKVGDKEDVPHFIYVGRMPLQPRTLGEKNPWLILEIVDKLRNFLGRFKVLMVGDGPGLEGLKSFCRIKGLESFVEFLGYVPHEILSELYSRCHFSFVPILMSELDPFWDGALKESLACQTPVIGFNHSIKSCEKARRDFGLILPPEPFLASNILSQYVRNLDYVYEMGSLGRRFVEKCCSWDAVIESLLTIYNNLLKVRIA